MATKRPKKPKGKQAEPEGSGVLASLPATRPARMSRYARDGAGATETATVKAEAKADSSATTKTTAARAKASGAKASPAKARTASAKKSAAKPEAKTTRAASGAPARTAKPADNVTAASPQRPRPVRSATQKLTEPNRRTARKPETAAPQKSPSGTELVTTVVQAAGELAQVGMSVGGQILKRAVDRLPKP